MTRSLAVACFLLSSWLLATAQDATPPEPKAASISGLVVKEPGSQPIKKVLVQLVAEDRKSGNNRTAATDTDGHFVIDNVDPGRYRLFLEKTGFVSVTPRGHKADDYSLSVSPGQAITDLSFQMLPTAIITGRVLDEDGEPMGGVAVGAQRKKPGKGPQRETVGVERTNDLGEYRLSGLFPGQYSIVALPPPDARDYENSHEHGPEEAAEVKPDTRYLPTYYPGTTDGTQASPITLHAGDEMPISLTLVPSRTYRVRGMLTGVSPGQKPMVELVAKTGDAIRPGDIKPDGQFEIVGVAPGSYIARAFSGSEAQGESARSEVTVVAADVDGVKLVPVQPFTLSGHLRFEGQLPKDFTNFSVYLQPKGESEDQGFFIDMGGGRNAPLDRAGNFHWTNVNPGDYVVYLTGGDGTDHFVKSVTLGTHSADAGFRVSGPATLEVVVSSKGATVEGVVVDKDQPAPNVAVVAVPEEKCRGLRDRFGVGSTDQSGRFVIKNLAPGSYTVFAWQDAGPELYYDTDFLKSQESNGKALRKIGRA